MDIKCYHKLQDYWEDILLPRKYPNIVGYLLCIDNPQKGHNKRNQGVEIFRFFFMMVVDVSQERDGCVAILFYQ